jgi:hypothetical protein
MLNATDKPYEAVHIAEDRRDGATLRIVALVTVGAQFRKKFFWLSTHSLQAVRNRAVKWSEEQRAELLALHSDTVQRASEINKAKQEAAKVEHERRRAASEIRIEKGTRCVRHAVNLYGKGRPGYWTGYVNVYGRYTDGDQ